MKTAKHPLQRIYLSNTGFRFKENRIVVHLTDYAEKHGMNLNGLGAFGFSMEDWDQFTQLQGRSTAIWFETEYATKARMDLVDRRIAALRVFHRDHLSNDSDVPVDMVVKTRGHRMQPIVNVGGVAQFKKNAIVHYLLAYTNERGLGLSELSACKYSRDDRNQFLQLRGTSVGTFGGFTRWTSQATITRADRIVAKMAAAGMFDQKKESTT